jgi:HK97 family phage major capsid protein
MNKIAELRQSLTAKIAEVRQLNEEGKTADAEKALGEAEALKSQIANLEAVNNLEADLNNANINTDPQPQPIDKFANLPANNVPAGEEKRAKESRTALVKALAGKPLTNEERALLIEGGTPGAGQTSGSFIVPTDIRTQINEYKRDYTPLKNLTEVVPTATQTGTFVYEKLSTITPLADLTEGQDIAEASADFDRFTYTLHDKGALLPVSNTLLQDESGNLIQYIGRWFAKKSVKTENTSIIDLLKTGKTAVAVTSLAGLITEMNTGLDPALLDGAVIITNQDGFASLDAEHDSLGRPLMQPDPTSPTRKIFKGLRVIVLSNANLPSVGAVAPLFVANLPEAVRFMDREVYEVATSQEAGFTKNVTYIRCIERYDVVLKDVSAYLYLTYPIATV